MKSTEYKIPPTNHGVSRFITKRWSPRSFADRMIETADMNRMLEAASWAASSMNEQPWHYLYAFRGTPGFERMHRCLMAGNQPWSKHASALLLALAKKPFDRNGKLNRHAMHDLGAANATLLLEAAQLDIYGHMMGGFHMDETIAEFDIDTEQWEVGCFIALGYLDDPDALEEPFKSREVAARSRKPVSEIAKQI